jgi:hypothetical protein
MLERLQDIGALLLALAIVAAGPGPAAAKGKPPGTGKPPPSSGPRVVHFAGHDWTVKSSGTRQVGPGPNVFSDDEQHVWVDEFGRLHLRIAKSGRRWAAAEVVSKESFGHGTYRFHLDGSVDALPPSVVLGLFTWDDVDPAFHHGEVDIEFSRWGNPSNPVNAQYVVQPYDVAGNLLSFLQPPVAPSTHAFEWRPAFVAFRSLVGFASEPADPSDVIAEWIYSGADVPPAGGENARMNLWMFRGEPPADGRPVEVIISDFSFVP